MRLKRDSLQMIPNLKRLDFKVLEMKSIKFYSSNTTKKASQARLPGNLLFPLWKTALPAICKCVLHDSWCTFSNVVCVVVQAWASTNFALEWVAGELKAKQSTFQNDSQVNFWIFNAKIWKTRYIRNLMLFMAQ